SPDSPPRGVVLELRPLPSTGVTRLRRYYEPLRHPIRTGLSLAGVRLEVAALRRIGLPVLRSIPVCMHAVATTPAEPLGPSFVFPNDGGLPPDSAGSASASPFSRPARRSLALRPACSPGRPSATLSIEGSVEFVASLDAPIATGWSDSCRAGLPPAGYVRLFTAH